jgi:chromosome segregation ATPase
MEKDQLIKELTLLERKIKLFMNEHQSVQEEIRILKVENDNLKSTLKRKERQINDFQNQNKISTIVDNVAAGGEEAAELKQYINEYIKEIDKCIAQLSA